MAGWLAEDQNRMLATEKVLLKKQVEHADIDLAWP